MPGVLPGVGVTSIEGFLVGVGVLSIEVFSTGVGVSVIEASGLQEERKIEDSPNLKHRSAVYFRKSRRVILLRK